MVMLGTKCPSITSTWMTSAPAFSTALTSSPRRLKSADKIEGAIFFTDILLFVYERIVLILILKNSKPFFNKNFSECLYPLISSSPQFFFQYLPFASSPYLFNPFSLSPHLPIAPSRNLSIIPSPSPSYYNRSSK